MHGGSTRDDDKFERAEIEIEAAACSGGDRGRLFMVLQQLLLECISKHHLVMGMHESECEAFELRAGSGSDCGWSLATSK